jgi:transposase
VKYGQKPLPSDGHACVARSQVGMCQLRLVVVKRPEGSHGFVLLPKRWVVERSVAWASRFRRLARDDERLPATLAGLHFAAFVCLLLPKLLRLIGGS